MIARIERAGGLSGLSGEPGPQRSTAALRRRDDRQPAIVAVVVRMVVGATVKAFDHLLDWQERARQRHLLMQLDERMLRDVGLTRAEAQREFEKPFWLR